MKPLREQLQAMIAFAKRSADPHQITEAEEIEQLLMSKPTAAPQFAAPAPKPKPARKPRKGGAK